jgi:hypothetical protein
MFDLNNFSPFKFCEWIEHLKKEHKRRSPSFSSKNTRKDSKKNQNRRQKHTFRVGGKPGY